MKHLIKKNYFILIITFFLIANAEAANKESNLYDKNDVTNYLSGLVSLNQNDLDKSFKYFKKAGNLKNTHNNYNKNFIRSLVLLGKFEEAFDFALTISKDDELLFEADLLLSIKYYIENDYQNAKKYFIKINKISDSNYLFENFYGNIFMSSVSAIKGNQEESFSFLKKIPDRYANITQIQNAFLQSFFETSKAESSFKGIIENQNYAFPRYNFFLINYLLSKKKEVPLKLLGDSKNDSYNSHLLLKEARNFIKKEKKNEIIKFFNNKNPNDFIAEIFYVIANLYSTEKEYQLSNFYLNLSLFLNNKFTPNKALLAENYFYLKKYKKSKKVYNLIKKIGPNYSWFASKNITTIVLENSNKEDAILHFEKEFKSLPSLSYSVYYDIANFYRDNKIYDKAIKFYTLALEKINQDNSLVPKILEKRGASYERSGNWEKAEQDLLESLQLLPDQAYTLNYLAYSWIEKKININKSLKMLKKAVRLRENDGYIIDSLGWAYYSLEDYNEAEKYLRMAVQIEPADPTINDHYADCLWKLKRNIQANYFWNYVLTLDDVEEKTKENINKKLIFGITNNL